MMVFPLSTYARLDREAEVAQLEDTLWWLRWGIYAGTPAGVLGGAFFVWTGWTFLPEEFFEDFSSMETLTSLGFMIFGLVLVVASPILAGAFWGNLTYSRRRLAELNRS